MCLSHKEMLLWKKSKVDVSSRKDNLSDIVGRDRDKHKFICMHPCFFIFIFGNFDLSRQYKYQVVGFLFPAPDCRNFLPVRACPNEKPLYSSVL